MKRIKKYMPVILITLLYSIIALFRLGDMHAPQTYTILSGNNAITVDLGENKLVTSLKFYLGAREISETQPLYIAIYDSENNQVYSHTAESGSVFCWSEITDIDAYGQYISFSAPNTLYLHETGIYSGEELLTPVKFPLELFDEQSEIPDKISFMNSTYFDEIYHARTAYEYIHSMPVYEWTHPPLGKILISAGIKIFGMTPFGWRIIGTFFGIFMLPLMYLFLKEMFADTKISILGTILLASDFMHFAQSRIATIDVYVTFFIMLMYFFMYKYYTNDFAHNSGIKKLIPCGFATAFAVSAKWTGAYAALGLAVIFVITFLRYRRENKIEFGNNAKKTIAVCVVMFGAVPVMIYSLSYLPYLKCTGGNFAAIIQNQIDMLTYHGKTVTDATHPFSSPWYQWPINFRPIWYYTGGNGTENISSFGNPIIWWVGLASFIYCIYDLIKTRNKNSAFLTIAYLSQLLPWVPVTRITFIYHYFPCVPFLVLMICNVFARTERKRTLIIITILSVFMFAVFYPSISGYPVSQNYVTSVLRWLPSWQLAP